MQGVSLQHEWHAHAAVLSRHVWAVLCSAIAASSLVELDSSPARVRECCWQRLNALRAAVVQQAHCIRCLQLHQDAACPEVWHSKACTSKLDSRRHSSTHGSAAYWLSLHVSLCVRAHSDAATQASM